jgi:uncharacterized membrane protein YgaE (UPF0421/DUF939 family)
VLFGHVQRVLGFVVGVMLSHVFFCGSHTYSAVTFGLKLITIGVLALTKSAVAHHSEQLLPGVHAVGLMIIEVSGKAMLASVGRPL